MGHRLPGLQTQGCEPIPRPLDEEDIPRPSFPGLAGFHELAAPMVIEIENQIPFGVGDREEMVGTLRWTMAIRASRGTHRKGLGGHRLAGRLFPTVFMRSSRLTPSSLGGMSSKTRGRGALAPKSSMARQAAQCPHSPSLIAVWRTCRSNWEIRSVFRLAAVPKRRQSSTP